MRSNPLMAASFALVVAALLVSAADLARGQDSASETVILAVDGMWNEGCEDYIADSLLGDLDGIQNVRADHENDIVSVDFDPAEVSPDEIAAAIENCPSFDVTDSETHALDEEILSKNRRSCCRYQGCDKEV